MTSVVNFKVQSILHARAAILTWVWNTKFVNYKIYGNQLWRHITAPRKRGKYVYSKKASYMWYLY